MFVRRSTVLFLIHYLAQPAWTWWVCLLTFNVLTGLTPSPAVYRRCSDDLGDRHSESMPAIPLQLMTVPYRSECVSSLSSWFADDATLQMWVCSECPRLATNWIHQALLCTLYGIGQVLWCLQCCGVSLVLVRPQWYWLDWNVLQVIIITWLHAMY
jgi:hypothetical protein